MFKTKLESIYNLIFSNEMNEFYKTGFSIEHPLIIFLINPEKQLKKEIENEIKDKYMAIIKDKLYSDELKPFYDKFHQKYSSYIKDIKDSIKEEQEREKKGYISEKINERKKRL